MLPKKNRANKKIIAKIFKEGKSVFSDNLNLKYLKNDFADRKISFIAPKIVSKKAVGRNLLKRRGYAVLEKYFKKLPSGFSGVFIFGKKSLEIFGGRKNKKYNSIQNLENEIKITLNKLY